MAEPYHFNIGEKVECIIEDLSIDFDGSVVASPIKKGEIYTVKSYCFSPIDNTLCIKLEELNEPWSKALAALAEIEPTFSIFGEVRGYNCQIFKSLETKPKTDISIFQEACKKKWTEEEITELLADYMEDK